MKSLAKAYMPTLMQLSSMEPDMDGLVEVLDGFRVVGKPKSPQGFKGRRFCNKCVNVKCYGEVRIHLVGLSNVDPTGTVSIS